VKVETSWRHVVVLIAVMSLVLVACSDAQSGSDTTQAPSSDAVSDAASGADPNGVMKIAYDLNPGPVAGIDPIKVTEDTTSHDALFYMIFGRFLRPLDDGTLEPDLAESVTLVDDTTIDIELREGLKFSDGSPLTAESVVTSYEAVLADEAANTPGYQSAFFSLETVTTVGPTSVRLSIPDGTAASWYDTYVPTWATSVVKAPGSDPIRPIGAGPYTIVEHKPGESLILQKNPNYWNAEAVKIGRIEVVSVSFSQTQAALAALQAGQVDSTFTEPSLVASMPDGLETYARTSPTNSINLHICKTDGPLADARVRKAINKGIDREAISETVYEATAEPSTQMWPTGHRLNEPTIDDELAYDPEGAKQLLEEAGYGDGVTIDLYPIPVFGIDDTAEVMQAELAEIGITINIVPVGDYVGEFLNANVPGLGMIPNNAAGSAKLNAWTGDTLANVCRYQDPELDALVEELRTTSENSDEAVELWSEASKIVVDDALGGFVVFRAELAAFDPDRIGDFKAMPFTTYMFPDPFVTYVKAG
jgi:peptide/nickel transport system substrate-binding protein